jgi:hypothetical protein
MLVLAGLSAAAALVIAHRVQARGERLLFGLTDHFALYADSPNQTTPVELKINGASVYFSRGSVDADVASVLDHFHEKCVARNGQLRAQWAEAGTRKGEPPERNALFDGVLRAERADEGVVACLEMGEGRVEPSELIERVQAFVRTGDASEVGHLRYVRAFRGSDRTIFLALWSEGELPLWKMFPSEGDAPGRDPQRLERPLQTRRLLSAEQAGRGELVTAYQSASQDAAELSSFYRTMLEQRGYKLLDRGSLAKKHGPSQALIAHDGEQMLVVTFASDGEGHGLALLSTRPERGGERTD